MPSIVDFSVDPLTHVQPNEVEHIPGGLNAIQAQLTRMKRGEVSGHKIVVRPQET